MSKGQTHNIHTFMKGFHEQAIEYTPFNMAIGVNSLARRLKLLADWASAASDGAFTPDQCAEVIRSWPEYKEALERLGGGE